MAQAKPHLALVYEPERACYDRLVADGHAAERAAEVSSYLAQSSDLEPEFDALAEACRDRGVSFLPVPLDNTATALAALDPHKTLAWTLTDGIAYFRGGAAPALARLNGMRTIGSDDSLFGLCQDKFRSGAVLSALGLPVPRGGLARNGQWLVEPTASPEGWFVKPNRLGAKIGIWPDSRCENLAHALEISRRIFALYRDDTIVQPYVTGRNVRASFLGLTPQTRVEALGVAFVDSGADFQTMEDSLALYGATGKQAKADGKYAEPELVPVAASQPTADAEIRGVAETLMRVLGLKDVFSLDFRVEPNDTVHLIEFEVCPGLPCFDFRAYCRTQWNMGLADAMAEVASNRFVPRCGA